MPRRNNVKKTDTETKGEKSEHAFNEAAESKVSKKNMTYSTQDFLRDKV